MEYRSLTKPEIAQLELRGCLAEVWERVRVKDGFEAQRMRNVTFSGDVSIGLFNKKIQLSGGIERECGIENCRIHNSSIGDNVYCTNVGSIANYAIEQDVVMENVGSLKVTGETTFGNGVEIDVLNEAGGRTLKIFERLSAQLAYMMVFYRHDQRLINKLNDMVADYVKSRLAKIGTVGRGSRILNCLTIANVQIGPFARIEGVGCLEEGTIRSCQEAPVTIGSGVIAKKFIVLSGSNVEQSVILDKCFVGQGVKMGKQFSAENSVFFCNSEMFHGEGCSVFAGPYTVSHHKSSLLVAGFFSFYNAGSGTNQSNHMYKLGPVHQGILERGSKTGSFAYLLWPSRTGPFTNVIGKHYTNFNTSDLPFSFINEKEGRSVCVPGMNMFTVGTRRDSMKWPARDGRKDPDKLDLIHFNLWSPLVIGKMIRGMAKLNEMARTAREGQEYLNFNGISVQLLLVKTACKYYEMAIKMFIGESLAKKLESHADLSRLTELRSLLFRESAGDLSAWLDINGLLVPEPMAEELVGHIVQGHIKTLDEVYTRLKGIHASYDAEEWKWCVKLIETRLHQSSETVSIDALKGLIEDWKTSALKFNNMVVQDALKEFDASTKLSFGIDGDDAVREADFAAVRGTPEGNSFVKGVKEDSLRIESRAKSNLEFLDRLA